MFTIDYALRIYTDMLNAGEKIKIEYFKENLSVEDFEEFQELIPFINLLKSSREKQKFQAIFNKVDAHKQSLYLASASNFRSQRNSDSEEATKKLNQIFDEEFGDE